MPSDQALAEFSTALPGSRAAEALAVLRPLWSTEVTDWASSAEHAASAIENSAFGYRSADSAGAFGLHGAGTAGWP